MNKTTFCVIFTTISLLAFLIIDDVHSQNKSDNNYSIEDDTTKQEYKQLIEQRISQAVSKSDDNTRADPYWDVNDDVTAEDLVRKLVGIGVVWSNPTLDPEDKHAAGTFWGPTSIGFNNGVVLTSGRAGDGGGQIGANSRPNQCGVSVDNGGPDNDPDLDKLLQGGQSSRNVCRLEFDFIPQSAKVEFNYVFASEEYSQWVNSSYNDVFGFFISGPNPNDPDNPYDGKNIAIIPFTNPPVPVSINNVNNGQRNCPNKPSGPCENCDYFVHIDHDTIQYNGRTTVLTARSKVVPCSSYHIKLAVADASDKLWDSGVFLEANSFSSIGVDTSLSYSSDHIDSIAVEDCNNATIRFALELPADHDFILPIEILGTAQNGVDYDTIPDTLIIKENFRYTDLEIIPFDEGDDSEIFETVKIVYNTAFCNEVLDTVTIEIWDPRDFVMMPRDDTSMYCGDTVRLYTLADGFPPFYHIWSTGDTLMEIPGKESASVCVSPDTSTTYWVKVWDECQHDTIIDSIFVEVIGPDAQTSGDTAICQNDSATLIAYGGTSFLWETGDTTQTIKVSPPETTTYGVTVFDDCGLQDTTSVTVFVDEPMAYAGEDVTICIGDETTLEASGGIEYLWSTGETTQSITVSPDTTTYYIVWVTDICDNTLSDTVCVFVNDDITADAGPDQTICYGETAVLTASGGVEYEWSTGDTTATIEVTPATTTIYSVIVTDGCSDEDSATVFVNPLPDVQATAQDEFICYGDSVQLNASGADEFIWTSSPGDPSLSGQENNPNPIVTPLVNTTYYLQGTDTPTDCKNYDTLVIEVKYQLSSAFNCSQFSACEGEDIIIQYSGNATYGATYNWNYDGGVVTGSGQGPITVYWETLGEKTVSLVVTEDGCESDSTIKTITINPTPVVDIAVEQQDGCVPFTVQFINNSTNLIPGATYRWNFGTGDISNEENPVYTYNDIGTYSVSLTVRNDDCESQKTFLGFINVNPVPDADFSASPTLTSIENPTIEFDDESVGDPVEWLWDLGDGTIITDQQFSHAYGDTGTYVIKLIIHNVFGCADSTFKQVVIKPHPRIYAPNAFAPKSTVGNERFRPVGVGIEQFKMTIYTRWGQKIFETSNMTEGWDGMIDGDLAPAGTYVYYIAYTNNLNQNEEISGTVVLIR